MGGQSGRTADCVKRRKKKFADACYFLSKWQCLKDNGALKNTKACKRKENLAKFRASREATGSYKKRKGEWAYRRSPIGR